MTRNDLLDAVCAFTHATLGDMILPCARQRAQEDVILRPIDIYKMRLSNSSQYKKYAPYVIHQVITGTDRQKSGTLTESECVIRSVFCIYHPDEQQGALSLLELTERFRIELLKKRVLDDRFELILDGDGLEATIYPEDLDSYYAAEIISVWRMPAVEREDVFKYI